MRVCVCARARARVCVCVCVYLVVMWRIFVRFLFLCLLTSGHVHGSRDASTSRPLSVPVGQSAFIQPDDVIVTSRDVNMTSCVVKVAEDDVATLMRVGTVTPTVEIISLFL